MCNDLQEMVELVLILQVPFVTPHWWKAAVNLHQIIEHHSGLYATIACIPRLNIVWV